MARSRLCCTRTGNAWNLAVGMRWLIWSWFTHQVGAQIVHQLGEQLSRVQFEAEIVCLPLLIDGFGGGAICSASCWTIAQSDRQPVAADLGSWMWWSSFVKFGRCHLPNCYLNSSSWIGWSGDGAVFAERVAFQRSKIFLRDWISRNRSLGVAIISLAWLSCFMIG